MESFLSDFIDIEGLCNANSVEKIKQYRTAFFEGMKEYRTLFDEGGQIEALRCASVYIHKQYRRALHNSIPELPPYYLNEVPHEIEYWQSKIKEAIKREQAKQQATMRPLEISTEEDNTSNDAGRLLKIDVARLIAAFRNSSEKFDAELFAQAFNLEYDESMKKLRYKETQKNDRIMRVIRELSEYLSPEERVKLSNELRK